MHLFRSVTPDLARQAFYASATDMSTNLEKWRQETIARTEKADSAYAGGEKAIEFLMRRIGEAWPDWAMRRGHYRNVPVMRWAVHKLAWLCYGTPPSFDIWIGERPPSTLSKLAAEGQGMEVEDYDDSEELSEWITMELEENRNNAMMLRAMRQRILDGQAVVKVWGVDEEGVPALPYVGLRMDVLKRCDAMPIYDPDDPDVLLAVAEYRSGSKQWRLWTADRVDMINPDLSVISEEGEHPIPGVIPFAVLGDGTPLLDDLVDYQKVLINRHSLQWAVERAYAFPIGEMKGTPTNQETGASAGGWPESPRAMEIGGVRYLHFPDPQGGFSWVTPDAPIAELRASYEAELKEALELGAGLPADQTMGSGTTPEQPTTLAIRWIKAFVNRDNLLLEAGAFEDARMHVMVEYGSQYGADFDLPSYQTSEVDWDITFQKNPLPHDDRADRDLARAEVLADLRLESDYIKQYVMPEATLEELKQALMMLKQQKMAGMPALPGMGGTPPPTPSVFDEDEEDNA